MALIKEADKSILKDHVPIDLDNDYKTILPDLVFAEENYIKKILGSVQYEALLANYEADSLGPEEAILLDKCQVALVNLAYGIYSVIGQVSITDSGIRIQTNDNYKTAFQWQIDDIQNNYFFKKGDYYLDKVLEYLEQEKAVFIAWAASEAYTITRQFFVNSTEEFENYYGINGSRRTFMALQSIMRKVEAFRILPVLGKDLYATLKAEILADSVSADNQELMEIIKPAFVHFTVAKACRELSVEILPNGIIINESYSAGNTAKGKIKAPDNLIESKIQEAEKDGGTYLDQLRDKLNAEASDSKYADYFGSELYKDPEEDTGSVFTRENDGEGNRSGIFPAFG